MPLISPALGRPGCPSTTTASKSISWERDEGWGNSTFLPPKRCHLQWTAERSTLQPRFFHFLSSRTWIGVYLFGASSRKVVCKVGVEIRVVFVRVQGFFCCFKKKLFFFKLIYFPSRSNWGAALLRWASGHCGFTACLHTRRALYTGKSPKRRSNTKERKRASERNGCWRMPVSVNCFCYKKD